MGKYFSKILFLHSEANASQFIESHEENSPGYYMHSTEIIKQKPPPTHYCVIDLHSFKELIYSSY